ncbi:hypothetical protein GF348_04125, partial [candidate division KSB3 bacterium]|nr:hypothetical protein [candidate division KSB3 bacterium]
MTQRGFAVHLPVDPVERSIAGAILLLILIIPFDEGGNGYILQGITQVVLLVVATLWAVRMLRRGTWLVTFDWIDVWVAGFFLWGLLSVLWSAYTYATLLELIKIFSYVALFSLCRVLFPLKQWQQVVLLTIFGSSVVQMLAAWIFLLTGRTATLRAGFINPNILACFLVIGINIGLSVLLFSRRDSATSSRTRIRLHTLLVAGLTAGMIVTVFAIRSRGAVVSFVGSGLVLTMLKHKKLGLIFLLGCCLAFFLPLPGGSVFQRLQKRDDPFAYERMGIWRSSLQIAVDHPFFGVGLGMFEYYGDAYNFPVEHRIARYEKRVNVAHSDFFQIAAELGFVGLAIWIGGLGLLGSY